MLLKQPALFYLLVAAHDAYLVVCKVMYVNERKLCVVVLDSSVSAGRQTKEVLEQVRFKRRSQEVCKGSLQDQVCNLYCQHEHTAGHTCKSV